MNRLSLFIYGNLNWGFSGIYISARSILGRIGQDLLVRNQRVIRIWDLKDLVRIIEGFYGKSFTGLVFFIHSNPHDSVLTVIDEELICYLRPKASMRKIHSVSSLGSQGYRVSISVWS